MSEATQRHGFFNLLNIFLALTLLIVLTADVQPGTAAANENPAAPELPSSPKGELTHKVIAPRGVLDSSSQGVALWHDYGSFALYRVADAALSGLPEHTRSRVIVADDPNRPLSDPIDAYPTGGQTPGSWTPETMPAAQVSGPALHLIQFVGPIKDEWLQSVEATGATPIQYIATYNYLLWADAASREKLDKLVTAGEFLQSSMPYPLDWKVGPALARRDNPEDVVPVVIQMYRHDDKENSEIAIQNATVAQIPDWTPILNFQNIITAIRVGDVDQIISLPDVFWIEERLERERLDEVQGQILAGNLNGPQTGPDSPGYLAWLDSFGFSTDPADYPIVDVTDDGIGNGSVNSGDPTLHQFGDIANPTRLAYVANCTSAADGGGPDGHGHINVSIAGGYDTRGGFPFQDPLGYQRGLGINPYGRFAGTRVFAYGFFDYSACGSSDSGVIQSIQNNGALINTNSWGCPSCADTYDDLSQAYDAGVRDADPTEPGNQEMIMVFAAGNSGPGERTVGTPGNGKNIITVGASENQRPWDEDGAWTDWCDVGPSGADNAMDVISFSSRGPSPGSRVKPEVIAPGTHIQGTASTHPSYNGWGVCDQFRPSGQTTFAASSGTSHSTPAIGGVASLAYWWLENTYGVTPSPAMMKAYLVAHPTYLTGSSANDTLPSNSQGYGMPDMTAMFDDAAKLLLDQSVTFDNSGETWTWEGAVVADVSKPVRIVLAYTDAPGAIGTSPQVNDLNLAVKVGDTTYLGNVFSGQWSTTGGTADPFNNYEAIFLPPGTYGSITITVTGFNIAGDGVPNSGDITDQDFALVCYNCAETPAFSLNATPRSLDVCAPDDATYSVAVGSILGFADPVTLSASGNPAGTTANFSTNPVVPPGSSTLTIGNTGAAAAGSYSIDVTGASTPGTRSRTVDLNLFTAVAAGPNLLAPADGASNAAFKPTFSWTAAAQAASYLLEVATDAGFTNVVYTAAETGTSHSAAVPLSANTTYYWRVTAGNVCGSGTSTTFSFTTQAATMVCNGSAVDFEDGIPADWTVVDNTGGTGIAWTTTADPACGVPNLTNGSGEAACADSLATGYPEIPYDTELVSNPIDLTAWGAAVLDVKAYYVDFTTGANDRFEVDMWDGVSWTNELSWDENHWPEDFTLNLSTYAGLPGVRVRFRYFGDGYDWFAQVDDIALTCVPATPPVVEVDPATLTWSQGPDVRATQPMTITNSGGTPLNWNIVEDDTACDTPTDIAWLSVSPDTGTTLGLDSTVTDVTFDLTGLTPGEYTANLCVNSDDPVTPLVQVPVTLTVLPPELLVCNGDVIAFEAGIPPGWQVVDNTGGTGIVWTTTADPACGVPNLTNGTGEAACADSDAAGYPEIPYDTELWSTPIDLTAWGAAVLDVKAYYADITTGANDRFEVDVWDGVGWTNELSWDENHEPEDFTLNLSAYAGLTGVRVRFRYFGDGYDWLAQVDDIALTCVPATPPVIEVDPAALTWSQGPDVRATQPMTITNSGGTPLNWNIVEDDTACDTPTDIAWLSVSPDTGTTLGLDSTVADVTFDSTGLTPGEYTANLCVNSDDPVTPLVQVPVALTVLPPFVLACNGDLADFETGIPPGWQVIDNEGFGVVWTDIAGSGESGNYTGAAGDAATASSDRQGQAEFDTALRSTSFDLSGWLPSDDIALNYLANYQNFAALDFLDLDISTDDGATWTNLLSWNEDHGGFRAPPGEAVSIDLSPYAGMGGLKLRWHYYDPNYPDYDWYAQIDAVGLNCVPAPVIEVDPDSLSSTQEPGQVKTQILTISNLGRADLDWSIDEDITPAAPTRAPEDDNGEPPKALDTDADPAKLEEDNAVPPPYPRSAPEQVGYGRTLYVPRPDAMLLDEGFEGGAIPPVGWIHLANNPNETWEIYTDYSHSGANAAGVAYDPALIPQDEWLLSPEMPLVEGTLSFWSFGSLFWCRDIYDNCDLNVWLVVGDVGGGDDVFVGTADDAWSASYTWSQSVFTLTPLLPGGPVRIGFQYAGLDGDVIMLDDIVLDGTAEGPCVSPEDVPWLSVSPSSGTTPPNGSAPIEVTTAATGMVPGLYEAKLCVNSTDPATPLVQVPVEMTVGPFAIVVSKTANPIEVFEPGDNVEFTLVVANDRPVGATISSLIDSDFDLATHCPDAVGTVLAPNASYTCTFTEFIAGNVGEDHENFATASVSDDGVHPDEQSDSAQVAILDVLPAISVVKAAPPYAYQGGAVESTVTVTNDSVATDPVTVGSMVDDVYGDITFVHHDIIATECGTGVTIQSGESYICSFTATLPGDLVGEQTDRVTVTGSDDEGNPTSAAGDATVAILPPNSATDSSLCTFDRYPETGEREFRLLFTPYFRNQPSYKLTASNPGQFYYNVFFIGEGPATVEVTLPYPYVTQGAMPVHVYGDFSAYVNETGQRCFTPEAKQGSYAARVALADHVDTNGDGKPDQATIRLRDVPVVDGFGYMNIHLDYGLKAGEERYKKAENPDGTADAIEFGKGDIVIPDRTAYTFSAQVNGVPLDGDTIINVNEFKRVQGVAGFVWDEDADPIEGALVRLIIPEDVKFDLPYLDATTDEDGWYMIEYKHKGKPTDFPIQLWLDGNLVAEDMVGLKGGNAFVEKHFVVPAP